MLLLKMIYQEINEIYEFEQTEEDLSFTKVSNEIEIKK